MSSFSTIHIMGGRFKGKKLQVLDKPSLRPTLGRIREAIFNVLENKFKVGFNGLKVLDLYAGTGALGCEALSRGATQLLFVEKDREAAVFLERNIKGFSGATIWQRDVLQLETNPFPPFDLFFMDPPYQQHLVGPTLELLHKQGWVKKEGIGVVETERKEEFILPPFYQLLTVKEYASTKVNFVQAL